MKPPYFPAPKGASPYREGQKPGVEQVQTNERSAVVVSRPEPPPLDEPVLDEPVAASVFNEPAAAPLTQTKESSAELRRMQARALLIVDQNRAPQRFRARMLVVPVALVMWRYGRGFLGWLALPLLVAAAVIAVFEVRRIWRRTEL